MIIKIIKEILVLGLFGWGIAVVFYPKTVKEAFDI